MLSTLLELAGFASIVAASYLVGGIIVGLYVLGPVLLLVGYAADDERATVSLARAMAPVRRARARVSARWQQRKGRRELAKAA